MTDPVEHILDYHVLDLVDRFEIEILNRVADDLACGHEPLPMSFIEGLVEKLAADWFSNGYCEICYEKRRDGMTQNKAEDFHVEGAIELKRGYKHNSQFSYE